MADGSGKIHRNNPGRVTVFARAFISRAFVRRAQAPELLSFRSARVSLLLISLPVVRRSLSLSFSPSISLRVARGRPEKHALALPGQNTGPASTLAAL